MEALRGIEVVDVSTGVRLEDLSERLSDARLAAAGLRRLRVDLVAPHGLPGERLLLLSLGPCDPNAGWSGAAGIALEPDEEGGEWYARVTALATGSDGTPAPKRPAELARAVADALGNALTAFRHG